MMKAILILSTLVGYSTAIKIGYKLKSHGFNFDKKEKKDKKKDKNKK